MQGTAPLLLQCTVFRSSIERWADGHETPEMVQGGNLGNEKTPRQPSDGSEMIRTIFEYYLSPNEKPHFLVTTVLPLKIHKYGLEKNRFDSLRKRI